MVRLATTVVIASSIKVTPRSGLLSRVSSEHFPVDDSRIHGSNSIFGCSVSPAPQHHQGSVNANIHINVILALGCTPTNHVFCSSIEPIVIVWVREVRIAVPKPVVIEIRTHPIDILKGVSARKVSNVETAKFMAGVTRSLRKPDGIPCILAAMKPRE